MNEMGPLLILKCLGTLYRRFVKWESVWTYTAPCQPPHTPCLFLLGYRVCWEGAHPTPVRLLFNHIWNELILKLCQISKWEFYWILDTIWIWSETAPLPKHIGKYLLGLLHRDQLFKNQQFLTPGYIGSNFYLFLVTFPLGLEMTGIEEWSSRYHIFCFTVPCSVPLSYLWKVLMRPFRNPQSEQSAYLSVQKEDGQRIYNIIILVSRCIFQEKGQVEIIEFCHFCGLLDYWVMRNQSSK